MNAAASEWIRADVFLPDREGEYLVLIESEVEDGPAKGKKITWPFLLGYRPGRGWNYGQDSEGLFRNVKAWAFVFPPSDAWLQQSAEGYLFDELEVSPGEVLPDAIIIEDELFDVDPILDIETLEDYDAQWDDLQSEVEKDKEALWS